MSKPRQIEFPWSALRSNPPSGDDLAIISVETKPAIGAGMDRYGDLHLVIAVEGASPDQLPCDLNGLTIRPRTLATGSVIDLKAPASHESVFSALGAAIVRAVADDGRAPWPAVLATVRDWQSAWRPRQAPMEKTVQVGLFGELWVLQEILLPVLGPRAIHLWSGADRERHDFCGNLVEIEVKTTRKRTPMHEISQLDQLWRTQGKQLLFVSVGIEESIGGTDDVAKRIAGVKGALGKDLAAHDQFNSQLFRYGWDEAVTTSGHLARFNFRHGWLFRVDEDFRGSTKATPCLVGSPTSATRSVSRIFPNWMQTPSPNSSRNKCRLRFRREYGRERGSVCPTDFNIRTMSAPAITMIGCSSSLISLYASSWM